MDEKASRYPYLNKVKSDFYHLLKQALIVFFMFYLSILIGNFFDIPSIIIPYLIMVASIISTAYIFCDENKKNPKKNQHINIPENPQPQRYEIEEYQFKTLIQTYIWHFNLVGEVSEDAVYRELIIRFRKAEKEGRIDTSPNSNHPKQWARTAIRYIIRELNRRESKTTSPDVLNILVADNYSSLMKQLTEPEAYNFIDEAIASLDDNEALLIDLHYLRSMSWSEIAAYLLETTGENVSTSVLRMRGARVHDKLRKLSLQKLRTRSIGKKD
ncbi:MAG: hypothetical protein AAGE59_34045 [Cyanobacteria bacterium P01_F01_bin.86]